MTTTDEAGDRTIPYVASCIVAAVGVLAATLGVAVSRRFALGVLIGGAIVLANFLILVRVGRALSGSRKRAVLWGSIYLLKTAALFGGVALVLHAGVVPGLSIVVGLAALVPGIVVGGLLAASREPGPGAG